MIIPQGEKRLFGVIHRGLKNPKRAISTLSSQLSEQAFMKDVKEGEEAIALAPSKEVPCSRPEPFERIQRGQKCPAVLFLHGFNSNKVDRFRLAYEIAQELSEAGISSLRVDMRGCGDSDGDFSEMTVESQIEDALVCLQWLSQDSLIDASRLALLGRSLGAAIAVKAASRFSVASLVLFSPVFDGLQWSGLPLRNGLYEIGGVNPGSGLVEEMRRLNIEEELKTLGVPLLHIHAGKDEVLSDVHRKAFLRSRATFSALDRFILIEGADHSFSRPEFRKILRQETRDWFIETLKEVS